MGQLTDHGRSLLHPHICEPRYVTYRDLRPEKFPGLFKLGWVTAMEVLGHSMMALLANLGVV